MPPKRRIAWAVLATIMLGAIFFVIGSTESFQDCEHNQKNKRQYQQLHEKSSVAIKALLRMQLHAACTGRVTHENEGFLTFLVSIFLAGFTGTLWWSTHRLWKAGRDALETTERAFVLIDGFNAELTIYTDLPYTPQELEEFRADHNPSLWLIRFAVQPRWKNAGNTPTRNMRIQVEWRGPGGTPPVDFAYDYHGFKAIPSVFFLAPKAVEPSDFFEIVGANEIITHQSVI